MEISLCYNTFRFKNFDYKLGNIALYIEIEDAKLIQPIKVLHTLVVKDYSDNEETEDTG